MANIKDVSSKANIKDVSSKETQEDIDNSIMMGTTINIFKYRYGELLKFIPELHDHLSLLCDQLSVVASNKDYSNGDLNDKFQEILTLITSSIIKNYYEETPIEGPTKDKLKQLKKLVPHHSFVNDPFHLNTLWFSSPKNIGDVLRKLNAFSLALYSFNDLIAGYARPGSRRKVED